MTKIKNPLLKGATGTFGDHYFRNAGGQTFLVKRPKTSGQPSDKQKAITNRFTQATRYAKEQMLDPSRKALYERGISKKKHSAYLVAVSDALNAPKIEKIDVRDYSGRPGEPILIISTDDFKVEAVRVVIKNANGTVLESDDAVQSLIRNDEWKYITTTVSSDFTGSVISATAVDYAGNETTVESTINHLKLTVNI